jgi:hypothetical protein
MTNTKAKGPSVTQVDGGKPAFSSKKTSFEATGKTKNVDFDKGGKGKDHVMFGQQAADDAKPGTSSGKHDKADKSEAKGGKLAGGGRSSSAFSPVETAKAGHTSVVAQRAGSRNALGSTPKPTQPDQETRPVLEIPAESIFGHNYKPQRTDYRK